jgi:hypothetical protein
MILNRLFPLCGIGVAEPALTVAHDQQAPDILVAGAFFHILQIGFITGLVFEELIDIFDRLNIKILSGDPGEIEIVDPTRLQRFVQRPLCEGNLK